ncbi:helix-turn-helix transcriptional regulator [Niabella yanshanensis]|uniref:Helix-turn-helix transcriptional regulator n=1 Tax=Niabella yanshanensis TaxID=577386 RepID=A0ABZ0W3I6_9BACT|nr:helix-turn-helix transcriptional regulator [Niabella yanshanensis]WQD37062.1 helix-turn-helix transcriptional regulator [Niabella yanshanensis]
MNSTAPTQKIHEGRNVKRFREMLGIKQDALAADLGDDWNQQKISLLEQKETIDAAVLKDLAAILKIPMEAIQNFDEEKAVSIISNTFTSNDSSTLNAVNPYCTFNPLDKLVEAFEEVRRLNAEVIKLKDEQISLLQSLLEKK